MKERRTTLILTQREIAQLIDLPTAIRVIRQAFIETARGHAVMPPKLYLSLPRQGDFRAMPAALTHPNTCGLKWVNVHPRNRSQGLPTVMGIVIINDPSTGFPLAIMDGLSLTKLRTAAAAAVAAEALARRESSVVGLIGCGGQADAQLMALCHSFPVTEVKVWGYLAGEALRFCRRMQLRLPRLTYTPSASRERCVQGVDLLVTITPAHRPLVKREWVHPGVHINAIGADAPGKQELDPALLQAATIVVDDREQAMHGGEINVPLHRRQLSPRQIHATLGEVLLKQRPGRRSNTEITIFDSTGIAIHDVALGYEVVRRACQHRIGRRVSFFTLP